jgi:hypothetical protein
MTLRARDELVRLRLHWIHKSVAARLALRVSAVRCHETGLPVLAGCGRADPNGGIVIVLDDPIGVMMTPVPRGVVACERFPSSVVSAAMDASINHS